MSTYIIMPLQKQDLVLFFLFLYFFAMLIITVSLATLYVFLSIFFTVCEFFTTCYRCLTIITTYALLCF